MQKLNLFFSNDQLTEVEFLSQLTGELRRSVRGKDRGAYQAAGSFQWTSAVRGLALLVVRTAARLAEPAIRGEAKSVAASLDYAISKQPLWLVEMFGCDREGTCLIRRLVLRTNPERKRPGPTVLAINERYMPVSCVGIFVNGKPCEGESLVALAHTLDPQATACDVEVAVAEAA